MIPLIMYIFNVSGIGLIGYAIGAGEPFAGIIGGLLAVAGHAGSFGLARVRGEL